ncbi:hypothetical protein [Deinococcus gobiensis]|uniref:hypothetical protein n=1 Tax=Deinococcus gobiensis TaxID=502394 RepID=UPI0011AE4362|nr:hypothetical protein [Deinococcus gobiensis]
MTAGPREKVNLLHLLTTFEEETDIRPGSRMCVMRLGRPWRVCEVTALSGNVLAVTTGHEYFLDSGLPLRESKGVRIVPLERKHIEYLMVVDFQKAVEKLNLRHLNEAQWRFLLPAATRVLSLTEELRGAPSLSTQAWEDPSDVSPAGPLTRDKTSPAH